SKPRARLRSGSTGRRRTLHYLRYPTAASFPKKTSDNRRDFFRLNAMARSSSRLVHPSKANAPHRPAENRPRGAGRRVRSLKTDPAFSVHAVRPGMDDLAELGVIGGDCDAQSGKLFFQVGNESLDLAPDRGELDPERGDVPLTFGAHFRFGSGDRLTDGF